MLLIGPGFADAGVLVEDGLIVEVGQFAEMKRRHPAADLIDAGGGLIMPALTNAHTHLYGLFARGCAFPGPAPRSFRQILESVWWRLDKALTREAVRISALYGLADHLRCGVTAVVDHHASPSFIRGSLNEIAAAAEQVGIRACLCYEVTDRNGAAGAREGIEENADFIASGRMPALFGLHAAFTVSDETLAIARKAAEALGAGFHVHLAEGPEDPADALLRSRKRTAHRLAAAGVLRPGTFVGHGVHLDSEEIALLAETGVVVTHQPQSNMGNAVGFPRFLHMKERGVKVALGTDGYTPDMLETLRAAATLHSHSTATPSAGVGEFAEILLKDNPAILSQVFKTQLGRLAPGAAADIIITDYRPPTPMDSGNFPYHVYFGLSAAHVRTVLCGGKVVVKDHRLTTVDEAALAAEARTVAAEVWKRL